MIEENHFIHVATVISSAMEVSTSNSHELVKKFIQELQHIRHNTDSMNWNLLYHIMSTSIHDQLNDNNDLIIEVSKTLLYLISSEQLLILWTKIIHEYISKSQTAAKKAAQQLTIGYRKISNFYQGSTLTPINTSEYVHCIVESLLCYSSKYDDQSSEITAMTDIILLLPSTFQVCLFDSICNNVERGSKVIRHLPSDFILNSAYLLLRRKHSTHNRTQSNYLADTTMLSVNEELIFSRLIERALVDCYPVTVIDTLLMQKPFDGAIAKLVVNILPESCYINLLDIVGSLWGERLFVSKGNGYAQEYLTVALINTLKKISGDQLSLRGGNGQPIAAILSAGVSTYLDQSDQGSRLRGMKIAKEFSILLGHKISFDELDKHEMKQHELDKHANEMKLKQEELQSQHGEGQNQQYSEAYDGSKSEKQILSSVSATVIESNKNTLYNDYDSSDSEIEGYDMPGEDSVETIKLTYYLRNCLEIFLAPDTDEDAYEKQLTALHSIPKIILTQPADAGDISGPLTKELLRLNNRFNTEDFEELQSNAVQALLVAYPNLVAPVLCWALEEDSLTLSLRCFAISSLSKAAYTLSGILPSQLKKSETNEKIQENIVENEELVSAGNSKSTVKRPIKLKMYKSVNKVNTIRNNFGAVAHLFFYPILHILAITISTNNNIQKNDIQEIRNTKGTLNLNIVDEESFIRNSNAAKPLNNSKVRVHNEEEGDGLYSMIPVEALLALAVFTKCSVNTMSQSTFTNETMNAAFMMKDSSSLSIRRASITALFTAFESWLHLKKRMKQFSPSNNESPSSSVLGSLTDVTGSAIKGERSLLEREEYSRVVTIVDWAVLSSKKDSDSHCRALKLEVVRLAIEAFDLLEDEDPSSG